MKIAGFIAFSFTSYCRSKKAKLERVGEQRMPSVSVFQNVSESKPVEIFNAES